jgi:hypothetical protein
MNSTAAFVFCFCMSSALQTLSHLTALKTRASLTCCLTKSYCRLLRRLCPFSDSVGIDTEGRFCWSLCWSVFCFACLLLCEPLSHSAALKKQSYTVPCCLTEVPSPPPSPLILDGDSVVSILRTILLVALLVYLLCMSSALQTAFTFIGTEEVGFHGAVLLDAEIYRRLLRRL